MAIFEEADRRRFAPEVQAQYGQHDDPLWFPHVTDRSVFRAAAAAVLGQPDPPPALLKRVYTARANPRYAFLQSYFATLLHVRFDKTTADRAPEPGAPVPPGVLLHPLLPDDAVEGAKGAEGACGGAGLGEPTTLEALAAAERPTVVVAGSWT